MDTKVSTDISSDPFIAELKSKLLASSGAVSSEDTKIESTISDAIANVKKASEATSLKTTSEFDRAKVEAAKAGATALTSAQEAQRGFATNSAALKQINDETDKNLKDLEQRKQELILSGEAAAAGKVSELMLQGLQFRQQSQQRIFENLLSAGSFSLNVASEKRQAEAQKFQQSFQERSAISNIALQYGVKVNPGDTIDTITARAAPFASEKQKLEISKLKAEINRANAEASKAARGDTFTLDKTTASGIASTIQNYMATGRKDLADAMLANVAKQYGTGGWQMVADATSKNVAAEYSPENLSKSIADDYANGASYGDITKTINDNPFTTDEQKKAALETAKKLQPKAATQPVTLKGAADTFGATLVQGTGLVGQFLGLLSPERYQAGTEKLRKMGGLF